MRRIRGSLDGHRLSNPPDSPRRGRFQNGPALLFARQMLHLVRALKKHKKAPGRHYRRLCVSKWRRHPDSNWRMKLLQSFALPLGYGAIWSGRRDSDSRHPPWQGGTLPLSYYRIWCLGAESNHRHGDFQSPALPTELPRQKWRRGRGSNPRPPA